jgi:cytochrome c oxidase subunit 1
VSLRRREPAGDDPWLGHTLEWATSSPPPRYNFDAPLPPVRSYAPLLDLREQASPRERERVPA